MTTSPNFQFLLAEFPGLARPAIKAEGYANRDPESALMNLRVFAETLATTLCGEAGLWYEKEPTFFQRLNDLRDEGLIEEHISDRFHLLRSKGNKASHGKTVNKSDAIGGLLSAFTVSKWFYEGYGDFRKVDEVRGLSFHPPKHQETKEQIQQLLKSKDEELKRLEEELNAAKSTHAQTQAELELAQKEKKQRLQLASRRSEYLITEAETRRIIDEQLRQSGWEANTETLTYQAGARPEEGRNLAIAEWPTRNGRADYALFIGKELYGIIEAKKRVKDIVSDLTQAARYAREVYDSEDWKLLPRQAAWEQFKLPFIFSSNSRQYNPFDENKSGIWFRDLRKPTNLSHPLRGWFSPDDLEDKYRRDIEAADRRLQNDPNQFLKDPLGLNLRDYQMKAIEAVEKVVVEGHRNTALLAMATGTGKTRTILGLCYRLLTTKRFRRILFLVDRSLLGTQAFDTFKDVHLDEGLSLGSIYNVSGLKEVVPELETKIHFATVQGMVKRILFPDKNPVPSVGTYDCIIVDEAHRGYTLDRDMDDDVIEYKDQRDFRSKYRMVLEHFDAFVLGLTATPAKHTTEVFGHSIFTYGYRQAVIDGWLIDHEPPFLIHTKLNEEGIQFKPGESMTMLDTRTQEFHQIEELEDEIDFEVERFNKDVITKPFTTTVLRELVNHLDWEGPDKTLIFAASDKHADDIVEILKACFKETGEDIRNDAIVKITGAADKPHELLKRFKNEAFPSIAVTVDLLSTGIDVPEICNIVFLRAVRSRILYEQMLGRATRRADHIGKQVFKIFDAVGLYARMKDYSEMKPVVVQPKETFAQLISQLESMEQAGDTHAISVQVDQLIAKAQNRKRQMEDGDHEGFELVSGGKDIDTVLNEIRELSPSEAGKKLLEYRQAFTALEYLTPKAKIVVVSEHEDESRGVSRGYGKGEKPEDYLDNFQAFLLENQNQIAALHIVATRPQSLTRKDLKELYLALDQAGYPLSGLRAAWKESKNEDIAADIIGFVRTLMIGDPLIPVEERVRNAMKEVRKLQYWNRQQLKWLDRIEKHMIRNSIMDQLDFEQPPFRDKGGFDRINSLMDGQLGQIVSLIHEQMFQEQSA